MLKKISQNGLLQIINVGIPFITIPWYVSKLGVSGYGYIGAALAVTQIFQLIVDYGFQLIAARKIAKSDNKLIDGSQLFADITTVKFLTFLLGAIFISMVMHVLEIQKQLENLIYIGFLLAFGQALTPTWLFLGRHAAEKWLILTIIPKILMLPVIFLLIKEESDLNTAMFLNVIPYVFTGMLCVWVATKERYIIFQIPNLIRIKAEVISAFPLFKSSAAGSSTALLTPIIINSIAGAHTLGIYLIADKIRQGLQSILTPVSMVAYPKISEEFSKSQDKALSTVRRLGSYLLIVAATLAALVGIFSSEILTTIFGTAAIEATNTLRILMLVTILTFCNSVLSTYIMLPLGFEQFYSKIIVYVAILHLALMWPLTEKYSHAGASIVFLITELTLLGLMVRHLLQNSLESSECNLKSSILYRVLYSKI